MKATNGIALLFAVCALLLAIGCSEKSEPPEQHAVPGPTADSQNLPSTSKPPSDVEKFRALLANPDRSAEDQARDAGRKPAEVLEFLQIGPAMTVIDLIAAGGYYTEVLSLRVGSEGRVYAQNPALVLKFRDGANDKAMTARLADDRLKNVIRWDHEFDDLGI